MSGTTAGQAPRRRRLAEWLLGRVVTLVLAAVALLLAVGTFTLLSGGSPFGPTKPGQVVAMVLVNAFFLLLLLGSIIARLVRVWAERRRGSAGSRLHVRLVLLFSVTAVTPALLVAVFAAVFFNLGIQAWFSDQVRSTLEASLVASRAYLDEHRNTIRADALAMAADLNRNGQLLDTNQYAFARLLATHTSLRGLTDSVVFEPVLNQVVAHAGLTTTTVLDPLPAWAMEQVRSGDVAVLPGESEEGRVRALVALDIQPGLMLLIGRPVDPSVIDHMQRTELAFQQYDQLDRNRSWLQITFAMIFAIAALMVLLAAVSIGLVIANQIARPLSRLIVAADRVRGGDLTVRVSEGEADDEVGTLSRAFNRMTNQLAAQRSELMEAYRQIDERRRFTETVLSGVSAGVVGLDGEGRINLPNRSASELLARDLDADLGVRLDEVVPEFAPLLEAAMSAPERSRTAEIRIGPPSDRRTVLAQIGAETQRGQVVGFVLTFDDITELLSAQRKAAWSDVARRIAHEIKNPLTPIQLSAERLKRKYLKEIQSDPDTFKACTDTIVRQVEDIGRMVDEFSAFARMPQPVIRPEDPGQMAREALVLQQNAHHDIVFSTDIPASPPRIRCDRRLLGQAMTNLLANAADAVMVRRQALMAAGEPADIGHIRISVEPSEGWLTMAVEDDGNGLPDGEERERLTEPYVTHKPKGTGLGLAIVKKIMEDHGGRLLLTDRQDGKAGTRAALVFPLEGEQQAAMAGNKMTEVQQHGA
ncbi:sensor histidine kinase NtrY-like [Roseomonas haemaphysalidis]|uniref:histidine kinase n=1 Tax=Roseomonas haemaphysalidis TaxID=2768162 RepID=A0ABS3KRB9_9PROT|nr:PAS domain-containing sensor histidine kinase [Roseomonas haemaphysalidis]MBO1079505.1 PAS domain-containing sensor histidine kinase [Roseomonas haemaphysalidis]